jgi:hypothetical protein
MLRQPVCKSRPELFCRKTRRIFHISRRCVIAVAITLGTLGPTTALGGYSAKRSFAMVAVFSRATRPSQQPISSQRIDPSDARVDPSMEARIINQLYTRLMRDSARMLDVHQ